MLNRRNLRSRIIISEYLLRPLPELRLPVHAPLAHPDAMPPALPVQHELARDDARVELGAAKVIRPEELPEVLAAERKDRS